MIDGLPINTDIGAAAILVFVVLAILTGRLVWHTAVKKAEDRADRWERIALDALGVADKMTTQGEVTTAIVASLPDPQAEENA